MVAQFERDGFVIVKNLLAAEEIAKIKSEVEREDGVSQYAFRRDDGSGGGSKSQMALWNYPGASCAVAPCEHDAAWANCPTSLLHTEQMD